MSLTKGQHLGPYEILSQIGAGGMGEVYRARDSRLERTVAVKILPSELSSNSNSKQRFEREAKAISNLSHPHICTLHDVGHEDGIDYLVMEYLEGQTLAERLSKGPLPMEEVLRYALQICEALDKAHRQGVVHRDLKPGNIMLTKHGVKLLDFGLAKLLTGGTRSTASVNLNSRDGVESVPTELTDAPTLAESRAPKSDLTEHGTILGTVQYMAPEQLEGKEADARTDIFAFGAVLYEMARGKKAFTGKSRASLMAAILEREPERLSQVAPLIPPALDRLVAGCLAKDPEDRWQTAHDLKLQLKWILEGGSEMGVPKVIAAGRRHRELVLWSFIAALTLALACAAFVVWKLRSVKGQTARFEITPPSGMQIDSIALSPQGRKLALVIREPGDKLRLWIRLKDSFGAQPVSNTDGASYPFWSPDESALAFFAEGHLKRFDISSGLVVSLCRVTGPAARGGTWSPKGVILFARAGGPLFRVSAAGGEPTPVTELKPFQSLGHRWPWFLPDGEHFLYWAQTDSSEEVQPRGVFVSSLASPKQAQFLLNATESAIFASGHLLYVNQGTLMAAPFDVGSRKLTGAAFSVAENVETPIGFPGMTVLSAAGDGTLTYLPRDIAGGAELAWYSSDGKKLDTVGTPATHIDVQLSPDGKLASVTTYDPTARTSDIWIHDTQRNSSMRLTSHPRSDSLGVWSPDGRRIVFTSDRKNAFDLYIKDVESIEVEKPLFESAESKYASSWSPDGKQLLFVSAGLKTKWDVWTLHMDTEPPKPEPFLNSEHTEGWACFSPDGKWVAYTSDEQGAREVFAISFPHPRAKTKISNSGGACPRWSPDGTKICYQDGDDYIVEVPLTETADRLIPGAAKRLFQIPARTQLFFPFDLASDGKRILAISELTKTNSVPLKVVLNWPLEFQKK